MDNSTHEKYSHIDVNPVSGALGAEIKGVDISIPLDAEVV